MPPKRPRVRLTETPLVARRLELAATRFPDRAKSRADLLTQAITPDTAQAMLAAREADWQHEPGC
jgi:hypothetical protein